MTEVPMKEFTILEKTDEIEETNVYSTQKVTYSEICIKLEIFKDNAHPADVDFLTSEIFKKRVRQKENYCEAAAQYSDSEKMNSELECYAMSHLYCTNQKLKNNRAEIIAVTAVRLIK